MPLDDGPQDAVQRRGCACEAHNKRETRVGGRGPHRCFLVDGECIVPDDTAEKLARKKRKWLRRVTGRSMPYSYGVSMKGVHASCTGSSMAEEEESEACSM